MAGGGRIAALVRHFEAIYRDHMRDLPIVNKKLRVEAVGFRDYEGQYLGVLITPWFMNLVLMSAEGECAESASDTTPSISFPCGEIEFAECQDDVLGTFRTAILFRTVSDLPDQDMARTIAEQIMRDLFVDARDGLAANGARTISRRALLSGRAAS